ncbi:MAG: M48 family metallopeptidase [Planctomycetia bacterium]|nr:M48 family metallopeptidase [Planctomycetia bacterium]
MIDFFQQQENARKRTRWMIGAFILATIAVVAAVDVVILWLVCVAEPSFAEAPIGEMWLDPEFLSILGFTSLITLAIILLGTFFKTIQLSGGGETLALQLGGRRVEPSTTDFKERRLINIVQEMSLASGVPAPPVFVMDGEGGINAFAAGLSPEDAVIGVTRGALDLLKRDELQGVIAHEFSHILNGDMRINFRLIGLLHGILAIYFTGLLLIRIIFEFSPHAASSTISVGDDDDDNKGSGLAIILVMLLLGLVLMVIGYVGYLCGEIIKAAVSRQREFLADASAVQFTRFAPGLASALKKIGGMEPDSRTFHAPAAAEASHLFFANKPSFWDILFATHPPLRERISRLEPHFDGTFPSLSLDSVEYEVQREVRQEQPQPTRLSNSDFSSDRENDASRDNDANQDNSAPISASRMAFLASLFASSSLETRESAQSPYGAQLMIYAILLDDKREDMAQRQKGILFRELPPPVYRDFEQIASEIAAQPLAQRLALADATIPVLKMLSLEQYKVFRACAKRLMEADGEIAWHEYLVQMLVIRTLDIHFRLQKPAQVAYYAWGAKLRESASVVLARLAYAASNEELVVLEAYSKARKVLPFVPEQILSRDECLLPDFNASLLMLDRTSPQMKKRFLNACVQCVLADKQLSPDEFCTLYVVSAALGVPASSLDLDGASVE